MKKIMLIFLSALLLVSCQTSAMTDVETHEIVDCLGRTVDVPLVINKVGCIYAVSGHITAMLGEGEKIVSVTSGLKRDVMLTSLVPTILDATEPKSGGSINIEELLKDKPDVIFVNSDIALNADETAKLDKFNIPYLAIQYTDIKEQQFAIMMVAEVFGQEEKAQAYIDYYNSIVELVEEHTKSIDDRYTVFHSVNEATRTSSSASVPADWIEKSGFDLVTLDKNLKTIGSDYYASLEQILEWNPDVIFCNESGVDAYILTDSKWQSLDAVKNKKVFLLPVGISRWGHTNSLETPLSMLYTTKLLYPEYMEDIDLFQEITDFYERFFDVEVDQAMIDQILKGEGMRIRKEDVK